MRSATTFAMASAAWVFASRESLVSAAAMLIAKSRGSAGVSLSSASDMLRTISEWGERSKNTGPLARFEFR
jgi:hypothetical protein